MIDEKDMFMCKKWKKKIRKKEIYKYINKYKKTALLLIFFFPIYTFKWQYI